MGRSEGAARVRSQGRLPDYVAENTRLIAESVIPGGVPKVNRLTSISHNGDI